jgi:hypothetical protein
MTARALLVGAVLLAAGPCQAFWWGPSAQSRWRDRPIKIDGRDDDWKDQETDDAQGLEFAFANDDKDLYVLVSPHTKSIKQQMAGDFKQDFTIWIDTSVGKKQRVAVKLLAPTSVGNPRDVETVGIGTGSIAAKDEADMRIGPMDERGVLEARIPLSYLGTPLPKTISVGLETTALKLPPPSRTGAHHTPSQIPKDQDSGSGQELSGRGRGHGRAGGTGSKHESSESEEEFSPIGLWIRVTLSARGSQPQP